MTSRAKRAKAQHQKPKAEGPFDEDEWSGILPEILEEAHKLSAIKHSPRAWVLNYESEVERKWQCQDIIATWTAKHVEPAAENWLREAATVFVDAFLDTGTHRDLAGKADRYRKKGDRARKTGNVSLGANLRYLEDIETYLHRHAARRIAGGSMASDREEKAPIPFDFRHLKGEFTESMARECEERKDAGAILLLMAGSRAFRSLLTKLAARWSSRQFKTARIRTIAAAALDPDTPEDKSAAEIVNIESKVDPELAIKPDTGTKRIDAVRSWRNDIRNSYAKRPGKSPKKPGN